LLCSRFAFACNSTNMDRGLTRLGSDAIAARNIRANSFTHAVLAMMSSP